MKPEYANTFGLRKVADPQGQILEVTLDISYKYMENGCQLRYNQIALLIQSLGDETL